MVPVRLTATSSAEPWIPAQYTMTSGARPAGKPLGYAHVGHNVRVARLRDACRCHVKAHHLVPYARKSSAVARPIPDEAPVARASTYATSPGWRASQAAPTPSRSQPRTTR